MPETVHCETFENLAVLHALGELNPAVRAAVEEHVRVCPGCAAVLQGETAFARILGPNQCVVGDPEPSDLLLTQCRSQLGKALDATARQPRRWRQWLDPRNWTESLRISARIHPGWSVAALMFVAAVSGLAGWQGLGRVPLSQFAPAVITVSAAAPPPPMAPAAPDAVPQPQATDQLAIDAVPESAQVYAATDAGMSDVPEQSRFETAPAPEARLWRHEPPLRMAPRRGLAPAGDEPAEDGLDGLSRRMERLWWGAVRVDPFEQQKRLVQSSLPEYPEVARRAGITGQVTLLLRIGKNGTVEDAQLLSGEPILGRAAAGAVEQWRYQPTRIGEQPVDVLTSVTLEFALR